jgi:acyl-CoA-binding protein
MASIAFHAGLFRQSQLFRQIRSGILSGKREQPGSFDFVRRAKFDAWSAIKGTTAQDAQQQYIDLVASLRDSARS